MTPHPLKILHTEAAIGFGGQEIYIYRHMLCMQARGHHITLLCQPGTPLSKMARTAGLPVYHINMSSPMHLLTGIHTVKRLLQRERFDVVNTTSHVDTLIAGAGARLGGTHLIVRSRHLMSPIKSKLTYTWLPHRIITVSQHVSDLLVKQGIQRTHIGIVPPIAEHPPWMDHDPERSWQRLQQVRREVRATLGFNDNDIAVGCVAVLREAKGHRALLEAIAPLCRANPHLHLVIAGDGEPVMQHLLARRKALALEAQIHLLGYRDDAARLMSGFDIFALATQKEAAGIVFLEAAQAGVPIIATRVGGIPEMLQEGSNAILVPPDHPTALTHALHTMITHSQQRQSMGRAGWDWIRKHPVFNIQEHAKITEHYYLQWLQELGR
ncbi:MAG TPA: glycosyltransferase family 4 protein [Xylella sp.]